jgi:hypothetical protein
LANVVNRTIDPERLKVLNTAASRTLIVPQLAVDFVGHHYMFESLSSALAYVVRLASDPKRPFLVDLHACEHCFKFFLGSDEKPETGRPRTKFCGDTCMLKAHASKSLDRVRESRANRAAKAARHK